MIKPFLIVGALKDEISSLKSQVRVTHAYHKDEAHFYQGALGEQTVIVGYTGIGCDATRKGLNALMELVPVSAVMGVGYAGALVDELDCGHLILAREVCRDEGGKAGAVRQSDASLIDSCRRALDAEDLHKEGRLVTVAQARTDPEQKRQAARDFAAHAVDMESAALAEFCEQAKIPFVVMRAILDPVNTTVPDPAAFMDRKNRISKRRVLSYVANNPQGVWALSKLASQAKQARHRLTDVVPKVIKEL